MTILCLFCCWIFLYTHASSQHGFRFLWFSFACEGPAECTEDEVLIGPGSCRARPGGDLVLSTPATRLLSPKARLVGRCMDGILVLVYRGALRCAAPWTTRRMWCVLVLLSQLHYMCEILGSSRHGGLCIYAPRPPEVLTSSPHGVLCLCTFPPVRQCR